MIPSAILPKQSASSSRWLTRQFNDPFVKSKAEHAYRSRSAYKLLELAKKYPNLLPPRALVVDLGAAPGGWSQVAAQRVGKGMVWAADIRGMDDIPGVQFLEGDFLSPEVQARLRSSIEEYSMAEKGVDEGAQEEAKVDTVLSDMMAPMSGIRLRDIQSSLDLVESAMSFAAAMLRRAKEGEEPYKKPGRGITYPGGNMVLKYFQHPELDEFKRSELSPYFGKVTVEKPEGSRKGSSEAYWVCLGFKGRSS